MRLLWPQEARSGVHAGAEAAKRVDVGRQDRHRRRHQRQHARHRLLHVVAQFTRRAGQQVLAVLVLQADVKMQPAAGGVGAGLGHKAGVLMMLLGNLPRQALQRHDLVAGFQHAPAVMQVQLVLAGGGFGHHAGQRQVLQARVPFDVAQQRMVALGRIHREALRRAGFRLGGALRILQVELQFGRHHREAVALVQALQHPLQHHARLQLAGGAAVGVLHRQQQLSVAFGIARAGAQRAGHRQAQPIRLARPLPQPAFNHPAVQIQGVDRQREVAAFSRPKASAIGSRLPRSWPFRSCR